LETFPDPGNSLSFPERPASRLSLGFQPGRPKALRADYAG